MNVDTLGHFWTPPVQILLSPFVSHSLVLPIFLDTLDTFVYIFCKEEEETVFMKMFFGKEDRPPEMAPRCPKYDTPRQNHTRNTRLNRGHPPSTNRHGVHRHNTHARVREKRNTAHHGWFAKRASILSPRPARSSSMSGETRLHVLAHHPPAENPCAVASLHACP